MASNIEVTVCLQDEECLEKLALSWRWARCWCPCHGVRE